MAYHTYSRIRHLLSVIQAATNTEHLWTQYSQQPQLKEDTVEPAVPAWDFNLKAYDAAMNLNHMIQPGWALNPGLVGHCSHVARTMMLPIAPPGQA